MVDLATNLGRIVPTPREVLEVIRPQLRCAALIGPMLDAGLQRWPAPPASGPDGAGVLVFDTGDQVAVDAVLAGLCDDALDNVKEWAGGEEPAMVYDGAALTAFIGAALSECFAGAPSDAVLDVLDLDEGVCESIALAIRGLPIDRATGIAACYFGRV